MVAEAVSLNESVQWADLVITGEGRMDSQTRFGKTPIGVAKMAQVHGKPVIGVAGSLEADASELYGEGFTLLLPIQERPVDLAAALDQAPILLERSGERIARMLGIRL